MPNELARRVTKPCHFFESAPLLDNEPRAQLGQGRLIRVATSDQEHSRPRRIEEGTEDAVLSLGAYGDVARSLDLQHQSHPWFQRVSGEGGALREESPGEAHQAMPGAVDQEDHGSFGAALPQGGQEEVRVHGAEAEERRRDGDQARVPRLEGDLEIDQTQLRRGELPQHFSLEFCAKSRLSPTLSPRSCSETPAVVEMLLHSTLLRRSSALGKKDGSGARPLPGTREEVVPVHEDAAPSWTRRAGQGGDGFVRLRLVLRHDAHRFRQDLCGEDDCLLGARPVNRESFE